MSTYETKDGFNRNALLRSYRGICCVCAQLRGSLLLIPLYRLVVPTDCGRGVGHKRRITRCSSNAPAHIPFPCRYTKQSHVVSRQHLASRVHYFLLYRSILVAPFSLGELLCGMIIHALVAGDGLLSRYYLGLEQSSRHTFYFW